jgi:hypothetical protein
VKTQRKPVSFNELRSNASCLPTRIAENEQKEEEGENEEEENCGRDVDRNTAQAILFGFSGMVSPEGIEPSTYGLARKNSKPFNHL